MKLQCKPTRPERRVQEVARNIASNQVLSVPPARFRRMQTQYLRWEAFSFWVRTIAEVEGSIPSSVMSTVTKMCPGFIRTPALQGPPTLLAVQLDEWVRNRLFADVDREGWFDALCFYSVRDLRSQRVWDYWEYCADQWRRKRPLRYPNFKNWCESACRHELYPNVRVDRLAAATEDYLERFSIAHWTLSLLGRGLQLPTRIVLEMNRRLPGFDEIAGAVVGKTSVKTTIAPHVMLWIESHYFSEPKKGSWLDILRHQARNDPRFVRIAAYANLWRETQSRTRAHSYPSFATWHRAAENYYKGVDRT